LLSFVKPFLSEIISFFCGIVSQHYLRHLKKTWRNLLQHDAKTNFWRKLLHLNDATDDRWSAISLIDDRLLEFLQSGVTLSATKQIENYTCIICVVFVAVNTSHFSSALSRIANLHIYGHDLKVVLFACASFNFEFVQKCCPIIIAFTPFVDMIALTWNLKLRLTWFVRARWRHIFVLISVTSFCEHCLTLLMRIPMTSFVFMALTSLRSTYTTNDALIVSCVKNRRL
jgi:hypothetical protein